MRPNVTKMGMMGRVDNVGMRVCGQARIVLIVGCAGGIGLTGTYYRGIES